MPTDHLPLTETIAPAEPAAVAEVVRRAAESGTPVYSIGGGTRLDYGVRPTQPGLGLSLAGMNRIVDYPARDLTITVEAGVTIGALARHLAAQRQRLPVDVPHADRATVAGVVATGASGPRRYRWGTIRDYVIGLHAVDGQGMAFSAGGRVVKNAAGYDLCKLLTGSLGTLGLITQVSLMVKPLSESSALVACAVPDLTATESLLSRLVRSTTRPVAIELLAGPAWRDEKALDAVPASGLGRLVVGFEGRRAEIDWMIEQLLREWRSAGVTSPTVFSDAAREELWQRLVDFPRRDSRSPRPSPARGEGDRLSADPDGAAQVVVEISALPSRMVELLRVLREIDPAASIQAHAGDGILLGRLSLEPRAAAPLVGRQLRSAVAAAHGSMVVWSHPAEPGWDRATVWGPEPSGFAAMRQIKCRFDPKGILNPGRFIF